MSFDWTALSDKLGVDSLIRILNERMPRVGRTILRPPSIVVEPAPAGSELVRAPSGRFTTLVATGPGTGASNSALGSNALANNTTGSLNTAVGSGALALNTTGYANTAVGVNALNRNIVGGTNNTAIGQSAMVYNMTGNNNTAVGDSALINNTAGVNNVAVGSSALNQNLTGTGNTAVGTDALSLTTGLNNTAVGFNSLFRNAGGNSNAGFGYQAGYDSTSGGFNTYLGYDTGRGVITGSNNTIIGARITGLAAGLAGNIIIADGTGSIKAQFDGSAWHFMGKLYPPTDAGASQTATGLYAGTGAPNDANGLNGDIYFRSDGGASTTIYQRRAGAWVGIV